MLTTQEIEKYVDDAPDGYVWITNVNQERQAEFLAKNEQQYECTIRVGREKLGPVVRHTSSKDVGDPNFGRAGFYVPARYWVRWFLRTNNKSLGRPIETIIHHNLFGQVGDGPSW